MQTEVKLERLEDATLSDLPRDTIVAQQSQTVVYAMRHGSKLYALKGIRRDLISEKGAEYVFNEKDALKTLSHPGLPPLVKTLQDDSHLYFLMRYICGSPIHRLFYSFRSLSEELSLYVTAQIAVILGYLHSEGWVYRDLKANNVIINKRGAAHLIDLGLAKRMDADGRCSTPVGAVHARPPEVLSSHSYGVSRDWWSLGVLLWEMLTGKPPFGLVGPGGPDDTPGLERKILEGVAGLPKPKASPATLELLEQLLDPDPERRLGSKGGSKEVLSHKALAGIDAEKAWDGSTAPCVEGYVDEIEMQSVGLDEDAGIPTEGW